MGCFRLICLNRVCTLVHKCAQMCTPESQIDLISATSVTETQNWTSGHPYFFIIILWTFTLGFRWRFDNIYMNAILELDTFQPLWKFTLKLRKGETFSVCTLVHQCAHREPVNVIKVSFVENHQPYHSSMGQRVWGCKMRVCPWRNFQSKETSWRTACNKRAFVDVRNSYNDVSLVFERYYCTINFVDVILC